MSAADVLLHPLCLLLFDDGMMLLTAFNDYSYLIAHELCSVVMGIIHK